MNQRIRCSFGREIDSGEWYLWHAISEADWEGGKDLPKLPPNFEGREVWVDLSDKMVQESLNTPALKGKINAS